jgi:hypothetical protein
MVAENPTWGAPRIHGELLMLGFDLSERTVSRWMKRAPRDPDPAKRWLAFLRNHREAIAAMDFFTVPTITFGGLCCFFVISHDRRRILHCNVTEHPTSLWIVQQLREAFPFESAPLFELKYDGFRALAYLNRGKCWLVSRNGHPSASFAELASSIARELGDATTAVFDGEIVCVDAKCRPRVNDLLFRRRDPVFFAFDLLYLNGKDLRYDQLADRKAALRKVLTPRHTTSALHYADHVSGSGAALYQRVCEMDLEGIVAKHQAAPYLRTTPSALGTKSRIPDRRASRTI